MRNFAGFLAISIAVAATSSYATDLKFNWKPGLSCKVVNTVTSQERGQVIIKYTLDVLAGKNGNLILAASRPDIDSPQGLDVTQEERAAIADQMRLLTMPRFEVDAYGKFLGALELAAMKKSLIDSTEAEIASRAPANVNRAEVQQTHDYVTAREQLEEPVLAFWKSAVGDWAGTSWSTSEREILTTVASQIPFSDFRYRSNFGRFFSNTRPCTLNGKSSQCMLMGAVIWPDDEALKLAVGKTVDYPGSANEAARELTIEKFNFDIRTWTLTDPDTLIPVHVTYEKTLQLETTRNGRRIDRSTREFREWSLDCKNP